MKEKIEIPAPDKVEYGRDHEILTWRQMRLQ